MTLSDYPIGTPVRTPHGPGVVEKVVERFAKWPLLIRLDTGAARAYGVGEVTKEVTKIVEQKIMGVGIQ